MNATTQPSSRSQLSRPDVSNIEHQPKLDNAASNQSYATASVTEKPSRSFLDILLASLSAVAI